MKSPFSVFGRSVLFVDCEECERPVNMNNIGACVKCRRVLCHAHLHGSFARRLLVDVGLAEAHCPNCRASGKN